MAKKGSKENPITSGDLSKVANFVLAAIKKPFEIQEAHIKDDYCNYSLVITDGAMSGKACSIKGPHIIHKDLANVFARFKVHMAVIDDIYKHADIHIGNIDSMHGEEFTHLYNVTGFKMSGAEENEGIVLIGSKYVSGGGRIPYVTPKTLLDANSSYKWKNELKLLADDARREVELYEGGKCAPMEKKEETDNPSQVKMELTPSEQSAGAQLSEEHHDPDFEKAKV